MKKMSVTLLVSAALLVSVSVSVAAEFKIGYVDIQRAVSESIAGKAANEKFAENADKLKEDILKEKEALEQLGEMLQKQSMMLTDDVRRDKEKDYLRRQRDYERMVKDSKTELQIKEAELTNDILEDLIPIVKDYGKKHGFSIIFERSERVLLYATESLEITDKIIAIYDARYQKQQ